MRKIARENHIEVIAAIGGGSAIDTAKATAYYEGLPVVVIPTVCATDAPCTGLSVIYHDDGSFSNYIFYPKNPDAVIVDTAIIAKSPVRFLVAGMGDALGTYFDLHPEPPAWKMGELPNPLWPCASSAMKRCLQMDIRRKFLWSRGCLRQQWKALWKPIRISAA